MGGSSSRCAAAPIAISVVCVIRKEEKQERDVVADMRDPPVSGTKKVGGSWASVGRIARLAGEETEVLRWATASRSGAILNFLRCCKGPAR
jgi:hypothetical protein